jgi:hypothetical protein
MSRGPEHLSEDHAILSEIKEVDGLVKSQIRSLREHFWDSFFAPLNRGTE